MLRRSEIINSFSAENAQSKAEGIQMIQFSAEIS